MFRQIFEGIEGIDIYPIFSLLLFLSFFLLMTLWMLKLDKSYIKEMENLPLDDSEENENK